MVELKLLSHMRSLVSLLAERQVSPVTPNKLERNNLGLCAHSMAVDHDDDSTLLANFMLLFVSTKFINRLISRLMMAIMFSMGRVNRMLHISLFNIRSNTRRQMAHSSNLLINLIALITTVK